MHQHFSPNFIRSHVYYPLAKKFASPYVKSYPSLGSDLENLSLLSVIEAQKTHDESQAPFDFYARRKVTWRLNEFLRRQRPVFYDWTKKKWGRRIDVSINAPIPDAEGEDGGNLQDLLEFETPSIETSLIEEEEKGIRRGVLARAIQTLSPRERDIYISRKLAETPETLEAIGRRYSISLERVRQVENQAANRVLKFLIDQPREKVEALPPRVRRLIRETEALAPSRDRVVNVTRHAVTGVFHICTSDLTRRAAA